MKCEDVNESLAAYLDIETTSEERREIETHLATCEKCREELRILTLTQNGLRQALGARVVGVEPSPQVWNRLSQRIESRNALWEKMSSIMARPAWRAAIPIVTVLIVIGALWGSGVLPGFQKASTPVTTHSTPPVAPGLPPKQILGIKIAPHKTVYSFGEPMVFEVSIINVSPDTIEFGPDPPMTQIFLPGGVSGQEPEPELVSTSSAGTGEVKLKPGEKVTYSISWDQSDSQGRQVPPGPYFPNIDVRDMSVDGKPNHRIGTAFGILIQPPLEPGERVVEVNQSRNVESNVFTLERIELKPEGMDIYASVRAADNTSVNIYVVNAEAEYSIDGGPLKQAGPSEILHNMLHMWKNLPPVPAEARELTFVITRFGKLEGPWEFTVPLQ